MLIGVLTIVKRPAFLALIDFKGLQSMWIARRMVCDCLAAKPLVYNTGFWKARINHGFIRF
jgi:hypothetical protein